jgi:hypothetical protein
MLHRLHPLVIADVALAFGQADERPQHDVLASSTAYQPGSVTR